MPSLFVLVKLGFPSAEFYLVFSIPLIPHFDGFTIMGNNGVAKPGSKPTQPNEAGREECHKDFYFFFFVI